MDIAATVVAYLDEYTDIPWYHDRPTGHVGECGTVAADTRSAELVQEVATVTLMVYANKRGRRDDLAKQAAQALLAMPWRVQNIFAAEVMGGYDDPVDGLKRRRITASVTVNN